MTKCRSRACKPICSPWLTVLITMVLIGAPVAIVNLTDVRLRNMPKLFIFTFTSAVKSTGSTCRVPQPSKPIRQGSTHAWHSRMNAVVVMPLMPTLTLGASSSATQQGSTHAWQSRMNATAARPLPPTLTFGVPMQRQGALVPNRLRQSSSVWRELQGRRVHLDAQVQEFLLVQDVGKPLLKVVVVVVAAITPTSTPRCGTLDSA